MKNVTNRKYIQIMHITVFLIYLVTSHDLYNLLKLYTRSRWPVRPLEGLYTLLKLYTRSRGLVRCVEPLYKV